MVLDLSFVVYLASMEVSIHKSMEDMYEIDNQTVIQGVASSFSQLSGEEKRVDFKRRRTIRGTSDVLNHS